MFLLVCDGDSMWPRGLHEPRALDSSSYLADRASLLLHCVIPISPIAGAPRQPSLKCPPGTHRHVEWLLEAIARLATTSSTWHTGASRVEPHQTMVVLWLVSSSCRKPRAICTRRVCVCVRGQPDWCDRPNYSWCALLHETEFPGMHRSYAGQQLLSRRPRLAVAALRHYRRAEPAFAQVSIRIASPRGVALGDNCESSDDIAHTAYRRVARRASPDSGGAVVDVQQLQEAKDDLYASCVRVCEGSPIGVTAPTTRGAPSCTPANFLGGTSPKTLSGSQKVFPLVVAPRFQRGPAGPPARPTHGSLCMAQPLPQPKTLVCSLDP